MKSTFTSVVVVAILFTVKYVTSRKITIQGTPLNIAYEKRVFNFMCKIEDAAYLNAKVCFRHKQETNNIRRSWCIKQRFAECNHLPREDYEIHCFKGTEKNESLVKVYVMKIHKVEARNDHGTWWCQLCPGGRCNQESSNMFCLSILSPKSLSVLEHRVSNYACMSVTSVSVFVFWITAILTTNQYTTTSVMESIFV